MNQKDFRLGLACKNSKEFMNMCAVYYIHHLGTNSEDIRVIWNPEIHTTYLEIRIHYLRDRSLIGFSGFKYIHLEKKVNGTMKLILDNGWDWITIQLENLSEKDVKNHLLCLIAFVEEVKNANPEMFGEFNPSERD